MGFNAMQPGKIKKADVAMLVAAVALFLSAFTTTIPSLFISLGFVVIGHTSWGLLLMADRVTSPLARGLLHVSQNGRAVRNGPGIAPGLPAAAHPQSS